MVSYVLKGITSALLVTVLTLFAGLVWSAMGQGGLSISHLLDIGLLASCLVGGYRSAKESGEWLMGGITGAGYVIVGTLLLALFLPIQGWGFIQVLAEGAIIGLVAGAVGAGGARGAGGTRASKASNALKGLMGAWQGGGRHSQYTPSYAGYDSDDYDDNEDSKFDFDTEENFQERSDASRTNWIETPAKKPWKSSCSRRDSKVDQDVEWSWEEEDRKPIAPESGCSELPELWNPERDTINTDRWNGGSSSKLPEKKAKGTRPWWEE